MELTRKAIENGYIALFDDRTRAAHLAALLDACINEPSRWATVPITRKIAAMVAVPAAELGAFPGLMCQHGARSEVWVKVVRSPHAAELISLERLSRGRLRALGVMRLLVT